VLGCTGIDVISILKKKRQPVLGLKVSGTGEQVEDVPRRYRKIHIEYVAFGEVQLEALERSIQLSEEKYCSAMATLRGQVEITHTARVEPAPAQPSGSQLAAVN
jgi:putative redox protein